jgi:hypothetical protein
VFQCIYSSCGHFHHPKCIAPLLDPDATDGTDELEKRIMAGMSFACPIHWCFRCQRMEDKTQRTLKFAVCRRCPKAYHRECLPRCGMSSLCSSVFCCHVLMPSNVLGNCPWTQIRTRMSTNVFGNFQELFWFTACKSLGLLFFYVFCMGFINFS